MKQKRKTKQKAIILDAIVDYYGEFAASDIFEDVRDFGISKRTVYNVLGEFCSSGAIEKVPNNENYVLYRVK